MSGHTPGINCRWTIRRNRHGEPRVVADPNPTEKGREMGAEWVISDDIVRFLNPEEQEEYARMIAAAPDLLDALKATTRELIGERDCLYESVSLPDGSIPDGEDQAGIAELDRVIDQARSAIKKARGEIEEN